MIVRLGNYIIQLQRDVAALEGVFANYKINAEHGRREIPFREDAEKVSQEQGFQEVAAEQRRVLLQTVGHETQSSALIRGLYRQFLEE